MNSSDGSFKTSKNTQHLLSWVTWWQILCHKNFWIPKCYVVKNWSNKLIKKQKQNYIYLNIYLFIKNKWTQKQTNKTATDPKDIKSTSGLRCPWFADYCRLGQRWESVIQQPSCLLPWTYVTSQGWYRTRGCPGLGLDLCCHLCDLNVITHDYGAKGGWQQTGSQWGLIPSLTNSWVAAGYSHTWDCRCCRPFEQGLPALDGNQSSVWQSVNRDRHNHVLLGHCLPQVV